MNKLFSIIAVVCCILTGFIAKAEAPQEITLTVSSDGPTKEDATKNALRSAIEQSFGTFVSANTTILNDNLVKDEIVTVSNGSIKSFEEISAIPGKGGGYFVTLSATVSLPTLVKYAQSHGSECEFAGNTFGMEMKLWELQKENEFKAMINLAKAISQIRNVCDYKMQLKEPVVKGNNVVIEYAVEALANENTDLFLSTLFGTLEGISAYDEAKNQAHGDNSGYKQLYYWRFTARNLYSEDLIVYLRNKESLKILNEIGVYLGNRLRKGFAINDNVNSPSLLQIDSPFINTGASDLYAQCWELGTGDWMILGSFSSSSPKDLQKNIKNKKDKFFKKKGRNTYVFPDWYKYANGYAYKLVHYKGINNKPDSDEGLWGNRTQRLIVGNYGKIIIPKEDIGKYSKFWIEPINK